MDDVTNAIQVSCWVGAEQLSGALYGCDLVVIPAGVPRKPGMTRDDLFNINAGDVPSQGTAFRIYIPRVQIHSDTTLIRSSIGTCHKAEPAPSMTFAMVFVALHL